MAVVQIVFVRLGQALVRNLETMFCKGVVRLMHGHGQYQGEEWLDVRVVLKGCILENHAICQEFTILIILHICLIVQHRVKMIKPICL